jgi:hypothetical protein
LKNENLQHIENSADDLSKRAKQGRRRIMSIVNSLTSPQEIGATMACLYLLNDSPFYYSHEFVNLYFSQSLKLLLDENVQITAIITSNTDIDESENNDDREVQDNSNSSAPCILPQYFDYIYRNETLRPISYYEFVRNYKKEKLKGPKATKSDDEIHFTASHSQFSTHCLFKINRTLPVVIVFGSRLPNIYADNLSEEEQLLFYQTMLILFKPFHGNLYELIGSSESNLETWKYAYDIWEKPPIAKMYLENNLDYYDCQSSSDNEHDPAVQYYNSLSNDFVADICHDNDQNSIDTANDDLSDNDHDPDYESEN